MTTWQVRLAAVAALIGGLLVAPVVAQQVARIYGTVSDGTFLPVLVDTTGRLIVSLSGGTITPTEINLPASTCADPALSETGALTTGIAFTATPDIQNCVSGTARTTLTASAFTSTVPLLGSDGTAADPAFSSASDTTRGLFFRLANEMNVAFGGAEQIRFSASAQRIDSAGIIAASGGFGIGTGIGSSPDVLLSRGAANRLDLATADSFNMVGGGASFQMAAVPIVSSTAPTVTSAGTDPDVDGTHTAAFRVDVGTGGSATTIVMAMPAATTGWNCHAENLTAAAANRANQTVKQQASTTTSVTVQNQTVSTGAALAFTASDIVSFVCLAY